MKYYSYICIINVNIMDNTQDYSIDIESEYYDKDYDEVIEQRYEDSISEQSEQSESNLLFE